MCHLWCWRVVQTLNWPRIFRFRLVRLLLFPFLFLYLECTLYQFSEFVNLFFDFLTSFFVLISVLVTVSLSRFFLIPDNRLLA